ncbi:hypothetical protein Q4485_03790 [Granulosicoccaceae sp. 1_MG-2023]|nr:hypothetical protein [Granulosicoccaceae sp. 1_MG-2023]
MNSKGESAATASRVTSLPRQDKQTDITGHARSLCRLGLSARPLSELQRLPAKIRRWTLQLEQLRNAGQFAELYGNAHEPTLDTLFWLASFELEPRLEPSGFSLFAHAPLSEKRVLNIYRAARQESKKLKRRILDHDDVINSSYLPDFYSTLQALRDYRDGGPLSRKHRRAKKIIKDAMRAAAPALGSNAMQQALSALTETYEAMDSFRNNALYRERLGDGFRGCQTNWAELKQHLLYSQAVRHTCHSAEEAEALLNDWHTRRHSFKALCEAAAQIHSDTVKLAKLCGISDEERGKLSLSELLARSETAEISIRKHIEQLSTELHDDTLTPAVILKLQSA